MADSIVHPEAVARGELPSHFHATIPQQDALADLAEDYPYMLRLSKREGLVLVYFLDADQQTVIKGSIILPNGKVL